MTQKILWEKKWSENVTFRLVHGDITVEEVDAIVNAANSHLAHGGGVAGAIAKKGGPEIQKESNQKAPVPTGQVAMTTAGKLPARAVIHAVGPRMGEGDEDEKLTQAVWNSLKMASDQGFESISMPAISSGIFGYPKDRCARVLLETTVDFLRKNPDTSLREVRFCNFDDPTCTVFEEEFGKMESELFG